MKKNILIIDDNDEIRDIFSKILAGYTVITASSGKKGIKTLHSESIDLIYLDQNMPDMDGFKTFEKIKKIKPKIPIYFMTGFGQIENAVKAMKLGALDYLSKPLSTKTIKETASYALSLLEKTNSVSLTNLAPDNSHLLGDHPSIQEVKTHIRLVAQTNFAVLLHGESGTGKELAAKQIHDQSPRKDHPFVIIDSGIIPESIMESELFGYEKGSFTDASSPKKGVIESGNKGTIFLDEIGNLSLNAQAKLLRVIQEKTIQKVGSTTPTELDIRFIFATNLDLQTAVNEGKFRDDLYYRIAEFTIEMPPLRNRGDDVLGIAEKYLNDLSKSLDKDIHFSDETRKMILQYNWPGNIRELINRIKRASILSDGLISPQHMMLTNKGIVLHNLNSTDNSFTKCVQTYEKKLILDALKQTNNHKGNAAKLLQLYPTTLSRKMKQLGI